MQFDKLSLRHVRLNNGGYDDSGCYWGTGVRLYNYQSDSGHIDGYIRAPSRQNAKERIRSIFGHPEFDIRFYR